ncbi:MAG: four helix bundle protein [Acidobacteriota bacterium]|nr:four helix bundle protein [Acidobacteriota bacterium]MDH3528123.1 four helix bundle protein [Acidobacteriota bacterium]
MATIKTFEEIKAWQKARMVTKAIYEISKIGEFRTDFELQKQMKRASVSMMANIAEGHGRRTNKEFANHLNIARGSCHEVQALLYVALDLNYIGSDYFKKIYSDLAEISKMTLSFARYLRRN